MKPLVIVDELVAVSPNLVAGANEDGFHYLNTNYGRDYQADLVADIAAAFDGAACPECGAPMRASRGVEVGNIFKLGTRYSDAMGCTFLDEDGSSKAGRDGLLWHRRRAAAGLRGRGTPRREGSGLAGQRGALPAAPGRPGRQDAGARCRRRRLCTSSWWMPGWSRSSTTAQESPGVKFMDADLIGCPLRLTLSERSLKAGGVEVKVRKTGEVSYHSLENLPATLKEMLLKFEGAVPHLLRKW